MKNLMITFGLLLMFIVMPNTMAQEQDLKPLLVYGNIVTNKVNGKIIKQNEFNICIEVSGKYKNKPKKVVKEINKLGNSRDITVLKFGRNNETKITSWIQTYNKEPLTIIFEETKNTITITPYEY